MFPFLPVARLALGFPCDLVGGIANDVLGRTRKILDENTELEDKWTSLIPTGRMGDPEDLMGPVTFLLSDAAKYVTGADLRVDGGYTLT